MLTGLALPSDNPSFCFWQRQIPAGCSDICSVICWETWDKTEERPPAEGGTFTHVINAGLERGLIIFILIWRPNTAHQFKFFPFQFPAPEGLGAVAAQ